MNYEALFGPQVKDDGLRSYFLFETFILRLLAHDLETEGRTLSTKVAVINEREAFRFDAVAAEGIDELSGPAAIEIRFSRSGGYSISGLVTRISQIIETGLTAKLHNFLLIYGGVTFSEPGKLDLRGKILQKVRSPVLQNLKIWDDVDIQKLNDKYPSFVEKLTNELAVARLQISPQLNQGAARDLNDWKIKTDNHIKSLQIAYNNSELSLFLGAGVSKDAGMPDWPALLDTLLVVLFTKKLSATKDISNADLDYLVKQYRQIDDASPLLNARYVRRGLSDNTIGQTEEFLTALTDSLYRLSDSEKSAGSLLLKQLARMCIPRRTGSKVRAVITYNFDDLLEHYLTKKQVEHKSIYNEGDVPTKDELPIYHCHGFLPRNRSSYSGLDKSTLVFSEEGYHTIFADPFHWSNLVQLGQLRESICLMVGLSMTDPNIRRLLEIAARRNDSVRHFALMRRISKDEFLRRSEPPSEKSRDSIDEFLTVHHSIKEAVLSELGVSIIWFEEYAQIPDIMARIQKPLEV